LHNQVRADVNKAPQSWDAELAASAQAYADTFTTNCALKHSGTAGVGENLSMGTATMTTGAQLWVGEKSLWPGGTFQAANINAGHYTQMIWGTSTLLGCGYGTACKVRILMSWL